MLKKEILIGRIEKRDGAYTFFDNESYISFPFSSLADEIEIKLKGKAVGIMKARIIGMTADGSVVELEAKELLAEFSHSFKLDPPNLAVYRNVESFDLCISGDAGSLLSDLSADIEERGCKAKAEKMEQPLKKHHAPKSVLVAGNSLVFGMKMQYGMCATAPDKDYFHYLREYISSKNPDAIFEKLYISYFEACENMEAAYKWLNEDPNGYTGKPSFESFTPDIDLITLQLGDNVNTAEKIETFKKSGDLLINTIKERCKKARIIIIHGWYNREAVYNEIVALAQRHGLERIFIGDIRSHDTECHDEMTFRLANGEEQPISDRWRTHPGNLGMQRIAKRIIENLGL
ncbi:MAG: SGNH/GDSL hydrolase family protein [Clostridia bacterium]|nr:SGNH/GDSL hydrolase family protein [Clostridia bacterium]